MKKKIIMTGSPLEPRCFDICLFCLQRSPLLALPTVLSPSYVQRRVEPEYAGMQGLEAECSNYAAQLF